MNLYSYYQGNPLKYVDPSVNSPTWVKTKAYAKASAKMTGGVFAIAGGSACFAAPEPCLTKIGGAALYATGINTVTNACFDFAAISQNCPDVAGTIDAEKIFIEKSANVVSRNKNPNLSKKIANIAVDSQNVIGAAYSLGNALDCIASGKLTSASIKMPGLLNNYEGIPTATKTINSAAASVITAQTGWNSYKEISGIKSITNEAEDDEKNKKDKEATSKAEKIHFNLDGFNIKEALKNADKGPFDMKYNVTNWEFNQVIKNPKTIFWQNGKVVPIERILERVGM